MSGQNLPDAGSEDHLVNQATEVPLGSETISGGESVSKGKDTWIDNLRPSGVKRA